MRNIAAPSFELWWPFGDVYTDKAKGLRDPSASILSRVRAALDGTPLVGFEIAP
jgi:hypothetical protein